MEVIKIKSFLIAILFLTSGVAAAQQIDSVRAVIKVMGAEMPRLSPVPNSVDDLQTTVMNLNGTWKFMPGTNPKGPSQNIEVPGEWGMQGFTVNPGTYAEYQREFIIPSDWNDKLIKLRCDAVYSECEIFINGKKAGGHLGGFTPFETGISEYILHGQSNRIVIKVRSESIADSLSSGSRYAVHPLGGISRKIYLMALPSLNCSMFHVSTVFDQNFVNATLKAEVELANESSNDLNAMLRFELRKADDPQVIFSNEVKADELLKANSSKLKNFSFDVGHPLKWDPEHPNLYTLRLTVTSAGKIVEVIDRIFGFKQTEVRGNQVYVNNMPIKLRGVCRHEVNPLRGRSLSVGQWEEDVKLFRTANINYIRTSHYPPAPELLEACDRLGMFVEVEGPFCWAHQTKVPERFHYQALIQPELEMVNAFRSNPSVLMWSIGNESFNYKEYFSQSAALIKAIDPTRPRNFSQWSPDGDNGELEIGNHHYPGPKGPEKYANSKRPITFDEYCHLNAYNRFELVTDPGIRDAWGVGFERMWDKMYYAKGVLGGSLWAAIDDSFFLPNGRAVGYGTWGPVDGWRRPKPEYWHVKKVYNPVKIRQAGNRDPLSGTIKFEIENRMLFTDLSECRFNWKAGTQSGSFMAAAKPGATIIITPVVPHSEKIYVEVTDPRGVVIDQSEFTAIPAMVKPDEIRNIAIIKTEDHLKIKISSGAVSMIIDKPNGLLKEITSDGKTMLHGDAELMVLPLNSKGNGTQMTGDTAKFLPFTARCKNRIIQRMEQSVVGQEFILKISETTDEAKGYTEYHLLNGEIKISYNFEIQKDINPRQVGLVFRLPGRFQQLEWERAGQWNYYPEDHIGRLNGSTTAQNGNPFSGPAGPSLKPEQAWSNDQNKLGTNDFRSTKMNITNATISDGSKKVRVLSDGTQSIRCWKENGEICLLVASYSNMGAEGFFRSHAELTDRPLKPGDFVSGTIKLTLTK